MPIVDLSSREDGSSPALDECDVCIVGTGPAGATLAYELSGSSLSVTVLESGSEERSPAADRLNDVENVGRPREPDQWAVRNRILGGSSHTWGGRCAPLDAVDFEKRPWVAASGWPFAPGDLTPYLDRSAAHLGLAGGSGFEDDRFWALAGRRPPVTAAADPDALLPFFWQFSRDDEESYPYEYMRFGRSLARRIGPNVTVATGATVLRVLPVTSGDAVRSVEFARPDGRRGVLRCSAVVLCTGGIENARILLSSDTVTPQGLGNDRGLVGRYLMDHPRGAVGSFAVSGSGVLQKRFGRYNVRGHIFRAGWRLSPEIQRREHLLNCSAWLGEVWADDDPWSALRRVAGGRPQLRDLAAVASNTGLLVRGVRDYFVERNGVPRKLDELQLICMVEQQPDPDSRVTLSDRRDRFGVRLPRIDWRIHDDEPRTMRRMAALLGAELARTGLPAPELAEWVRDGASFPPDFVDVAHPTGTTRMSDDPATGVVDTDCRVHGVEGLYVAGSSVFPTVGHCNPTQTIVALAIRLADHLKARARATTSLPVPAATPAPRPDRVLVTGATGRIGRVVVADLLERGYCVRATTSKTPPRDTHDGALEWRQFDFLQAAGPDYDALVDGCAAVLHLAAEIGEQDRMQRVNADATGHLVEAAERARTGAFCYTSSVSVYGSGRRRAAPEDAPVLTVDRDVRSEYWALDYVRTYGRTKLAGERVLRAAASAVSYVVLRPTVVVDVDDILEIRDWNPVKRVLAAHRHAHHIYVRDVSDAMIWSMRRALAAAPGSVETFNLSEDEYPEPRHADFLRKGLAASGDPRFRVSPRVPGAVDWLHDFLRFHTLPLRRPLWQMRFPNDRLREAGYRPRFGLAYAYSLALLQAREQSTDEAGTAALQDA